MNIEKSRWFKTINGPTGIVSIAVFAIIFIVLAFIYIKRIRKDPLKIFSIYTDDHRSRRTKILKLIVFLMLATGFVAVVYYNIRKMAKGDPNISITVENNTFTPSILFCPGDNETISI